MMTSKKRRKKVTRERMPPPPEDEGYPQERSEKLASKRAEIEAYHVQRREASLTGGPTREAALKLSAGLPPSYRWCEESMGPRPRTYRRAPPPVPCVSCDAWKNERGAQAVTCYGIQSLASGTERAYLCCSVCYSRFVLDVGEPEEELRIRYPPKGRERRDGKAGRG